MADEINQETGEVIEADRPKRPPIPQVIAKAIIAVNKKVKSLAKDEQNTFAKFKYTSVDAFYEAIGPLMADAGIFVFTDEVDTQIERRESTDDQGRSRVTNWLVSKYELMIYHESGAEWGPICREMMVSATGPQAYGSGQSYVEKYFLRGLFKVPTGDADADSHPQAGLPEKPQTRGATRTARPALPVTTVPTTRQTQAPDTASTEKADEAVQRVKWIKSLLAEPNYMISRSRGWSFWEKIYLEAANLADTEEQLEKLRLDNAEHLEKFKAEHRPEVYTAFAQQVAANVKRLKMQSAVTPDEAKDVLMG